MKVVGASLLLATLPTATAFQPPSRNMGWMLASKLTEGEELTGVELYRFRPEKLAGELEIKIFTFFEPAFVHL